MSELEIGSKMGKDPSELYKFREKIGKGSFGEVYKADDTTKKKVVAIKIIDLEKSEGKDYLFKQLLNITNSFL